MARVFIILGIVFLVLGIAAAWAPWLFSWFGRLPGDIRIERANGVFFLPLTSMLVVSILLSILVSVFFRR